MFGAAAVRLGQPAQALGGEALVVTAHHLNHRGGLANGEFAAQTVADFAERGVSRATKFAYVLREPVLDPQRFGETVAVNRGMFVKAFDSPEDALQWLGIAPANKPDAGDGK